MSKISVLVVEDESIVSRDIQHSLLKLGYAIFGSASSGEKVLEILEEGTPDIILMDIMLKGEMNGVETAGIIKAEYGIPVIYLTAYADEATINKAKVTEPYGYIIKPFKEIDLHTSIEMAYYKNKRIDDIKKNKDFLFSRKQGTKKQDFIFVKANSKLIKLKTAEIYFIEALKDYVVINTLTKRYTIHSTMKDIEKKLGSENFTRVHRSYIVRIDKISSIEYPNIHLENDKKMVPIGGSYRESLVKKLNLV